MRTPVQKFAKNENVSLRFIYKEAAAGRLTLTKVGSRTFVDDVDADHWRALAPKVNGTAGDVVMKIAEQKLRELGQAVADGIVDRTHAVARLSHVAAVAGLIIHEAA
jgi:hypothetical protein